MNCPERTLIRRGATMLLAAILAVFGLAGGLAAQDCGDLDFSGLVDIIDASTLIDYLVLTHTPLIVPDAAADMDGVPGVNMNDMLTLIKYINDQSTGSPAPLDCSVTPDTSFQPSEDTIIVRRTSHGYYEVWIHAVDEYQGISLTLSYDCLTSTPHLYSIVGMAGEVDAAGQRVFVHSGFPELMPAGDYVVAKLYFEFNPQDLGPHYVTFQYSDYTPSNTTVISREGVGYRTFDGFVPALAVDQSNNCCWRYTGNVNCDPDEIVDVSDIQALIDNLFLTMSPLCCEAEANLNYPGSGYADEDDIVDITDLTILIDNQYLSLAPLPACP